MSDTIAGGKVVVVDQIAVQRGTVGRGRLARVQTTRGLVDVDIVMIGIGERAAAAALTALMKAMPEKGRNESVRIALNMKENVHVDVREEVKKGNTHDALVVRPRRRKQRE